MKTPFVSKHSWANNINQHSINQYFGKFVKQMAQSAMILHRIIQESSLLFLEDRYTNGIFGSRGLLCHCCLQPRHMYQEYSRIPYL